MSAHKKTVFIVGAGASYDVGFPIGATLKKSISQLLSYQYNDGNDRISDDLIYEALRSHGDGPGLHHKLQACKSISETMPNERSIDSYVHKHQGDSNIENCAKLAIVRAILAKEKESPIKLDNKINSIDFNNTDQLWYSTFLHLVATCTENEIAERLASLCFIIFNYDRCVEHFFYYAIKGSFRFDDKQTAIVMQNLKVIHPYGVVGRLPWEPDNGETKVEFGEELSAHGLVKVSSQIKTFTESNSVKILDDIRAKFINSNKWYFLGFGFEELNMKLLFGNNKVHKEKKRKIFGTALNIPERSIESIKAHLNTFSLHPPLLSYIDCKEFFKEYAVDIQM